MTTAQDKCTMKRPIKTTLRKGQKDMTDSNPSGIMVLPWPPQQMGLMYDTAHTQQKIL